MSAAFVDTISSQTMNLDLTKTLGVGRDLGALCTDLFLIVIRMREAEELGEPAALRKLINYYVDLFMKNAKVTGVDKELVARAQYALVALIDETVLSIPGACRDYWLSRPLQLDLFGDNLAGEEFYRILDKMLLSPEKYKDVLDIYYLCLSLGFEGKYKMARTEQRLSVMDDLGRKLRRARPRSSAGLSPHGRRVDVGLTRKKRRTEPFPLWLPAVVGTAAIALIWFLLSFMNSAHLDRTLHTIAPLVGR